MKLALSLLVATLIVPAALAQRPTGNATTIQWQGTAPQPVGVSIYHKPISGYTWFWVKVIYSAGATASIVAESLDTAQAACTVHHSSTDLTFTVYTDGADRCDYRYLVTYGSPLTQVFSFKSQGGDVNIELADGLETIRAINVTSNVLRFSNSHMTDKYPNVLDMYLTHQAYLDLHSIHTVGIQGGDKNTKIFHSMPGPPVCPPSETCNSVPGIYASGVTGPKQDYRVKITEAVSKVYIGGGSSVTKSILGGHEAVNSPEQADYVVDFGNTSPPDSSVQVNTHIESHLIDSDLPHYDEPWKSDARTRTAMTPALLIVMGISTIFACH